jgi:hypothetical protein
MELGCVELEQLEYIELKHMKVGSSTVPLAISKSTIKRECVPSLFIILYTIMVWYNMVIW